MTNLEPSVIVFYEKDGELNMTKLTEIEQYEADKEYVNRFVKPKIGRVGPFESLYNTTVFWNSQPQAVNMREAANLFKKLTKQVAEIRAEIKLQTVLTSNVGLEDISVQNRTIKRLQDELKELKRGWTEPS